MDALPPILLTLPSWFNGVSERRHTHIYPPILVQQTNIEKKALHQSNFSGMEVHSWKGGLWGLELVIDDDVELL
jgi:hypothetical protein